MILGYRRTGPEEVPHATDGRGRPPAGSAAGVSGGRPARRGRGEPPGGTVASVASVAGVLVPALLLLIGAVLVVLLLSG